MKYFYPWKNDDELFDLIRGEFFTSVVGDVMDKLGYLHQPLRTDMFVAGRAMTVLEADVFSESVESHNPMMAKPFGLMFEALDDLKKNEVYICTGSSPNYALWGELMSTRAQILGAAGAVVDGYSRDTHGVLALDFPTFSHGSYGQDQGPRGKVIDYRVPIKMQGVTINSGDIVIGAHQRIDGVFAINDPTAKGVLNAALQAGRSEFLIASVDGSPSPHKMSSAKKASGSLPQHKMGVLFIFSFPAFLLLLC